MKYKEFKKGEKLPSAFSLNGEETSSEVSFLFKRTSNENVVNIDSRRHNYSRQEVFNFAMILLKIAGEMREYKE